jgi:signal transduction histidine kinase/CheY-like chemotaxis protein
MKAHTHTHPQLRALLLAPHGRDAVIAERIVRQAGVATEICPDLPQLVAALRDEVAFVLLTEDVIHSADFKPLVQWISRQPAWSDLPFILVTDGGGPERNPMAGRWLEALGNVTFIERPFHPTTLVSIARSTFKGRQRQYALQQSHDDLERRVAERTAQLQQAHNQVLSQIAERERTEEQLRHMQKIESIGELTGGVAHDFNNLLTAVIGNLELLKRRIPQNPSTDRLIDGAMQGAQRGAALTQRLLAFARRQTLEPHPIDLAELVCGMDDLLRRSLGPTIEMQLDLPPSLPAAQADANQIELALLNLAINGRDAMPNGGRLGIGLSLETSPDTPDLAAGRYLCLSVTDTGVGMDAETLQRAVEPFYSTKEVGKGTGLGLSMIHGVARQLKGALRLHSELLHGTRAELWLPMSMQDAPRFPAVSERGQTDRERDRATLLLVEDDFLIGLSTTSLLEDLGHAVIQASSGASALQILRSEKPVDLMITDYAMPGMTGIELAEAARKLRPGLPILLATGYADLPSPSGLDLPRLSKPYQQTQLAEHIGVLIRPNASRH